MNIFMEELNEQSFDWLTWRNGSILKIFGIRHRFEPIIRNKDIIRKYAVGYCRTDNIPCRPKPGYIAVMFDTNEQNCNRWWTHFTENGFYGCFSGDDSGT